MLKMSTEIIINKRKYILAEDVMKHAPLFFKGCRNIRVIISKKEIDENNYIYCQYINNEWIIKSGSSRKLDKLFLRKKWVEEHAPEYSSGVEHDIKEAPEIIDLEDSEKICDNEGNVYEIETRGERKYGGCYFLVNDVAKCFNIKRLYNAIINEDRGYEYNTHYKYFNSKKGFSDAKTNF